ncbi:MAG TPA: ABC transporter substrate-binding protein [Stellaceae bacterium]|jgi:NitT/TauT family transport system substrate-binding protein|nr:ABC transporter substrate-binding protein [Stellaceae bacterium]
MKSQALHISLLVAFAATAIAAPTRAESIKIGISKLIGYPGVPIAAERGYFKEQGIEPELVFFDSAEPIAVAVASGDVQFGTAGMSAGFYTLAAGGQLRLIASSAGDAPGFYNLGFIVSNKASDAGLKEVKDIKGRAVAVTQVGTSLEYALGQAVRRYGFTMADIALKPLQSNTNVIAAISGGTVDAAVMPSGPILGPIQKGEFRLLAWAADVAPNLTGSATFTSTKEANEHGDTVKRFLTAYRQGLRDFATAFMSADGKRADGPTAPAILDLMSTYTGIPAAQIDKAIPYVDPDGRIDAASVADQIAWYKSQGLLKGDIDANKLIDNRYALTTVAAGK